MRWLDGLGRWFRLLLDPSKRYRHTFVEDPPSQLEDSLVYLIGDGGRPWSASFKCPCGCGEAISLSLIEHDNPSWHVSTRTSGITIHPSVWRTKGCRSHFFIRDGRVLWAKEERRR